MLKLEHMVIEFPGHVCGYSCALNILGYHPLTNDFVVSPANGYSDDREYVGRARNTCLKVSFVPPAVGYTPEWYENYREIPLPTGECLYIAEVTKWFDPNDGEYPIEECETNLDLTYGNPDEGNVICFPSLSATNNLALYHPEARYGFIISSFNQCRVEYPNLKLIYRNNEALVNLSYNYRDNPRIFYAIYQNLLEK